MSGEIRVRMKVGNGVRVRVRRELEGEQAHRKRVRESAASFLYEDDGSVMSKLTL